MNVFDPVEHIKNHPDVFTPDATTSFIGGTYIKEFRLEADMAIVSHRHSYDHASILASGEVTVRIDGERTSYVGPAVLIIKAGQEHVIIAVTPAVWFCVHAVDQTTEAYKNQDAHSTDGMLIVKHGRAA